MARAWIEPATHRVQLTRRNQLSHKAFILLQSNRNISPHVMLTLTTLLATYEQRNFSRLSLSHYQSVSTLRFNNSLPIRWISSKSFFLVAALIWRTVSLPILGNYALVMLLWLPCLPCRRSEGAKTSSSVGVKEGNIFLLLCSNVKALWPSHRGHLIM